MLTQVPESDAVRLLPPVPASLCDSNGQPCFGRYAGLPDSLDWQGLHSSWRRNPLWQRLHHKHWYYVGIVTEQLFCAVAMVDVGWISTAFVYVYDRRQQRMLADLSHDGLPGSRADIDTGLGPGSRASFAHGPAQIDWQRESGGYRLTLRWGQLKLDAWLDDSRAGAPLTAIGRPEGGTVHATCKSAALRLQGQLVCGGQQFELDGGVASFDRSHGFLARETSWRWAFAQSEQFGFNLQSGYLGEQENCLWLDGQLIALAAVSFEFDPANPLTPWQISSSDGLLELEFRPLACRTQNKNLLIAVSRYQQPLGSFHGQLRGSATSPARRVDGLAGVTEQHFSRW